MTSPHVVHVFPAFSTGGPEVRTCALINAFGDEFRHTVVALNGDVSGAARLARPDHVAFITPDVRPTPRLLAFGRLLKGLAPDLLITYGWGGTDALVAARLKRIKSLLHVEDGFLPDEAHQQKRARQLARRVAFPRARRVIVPSRNLERIAIRDWGLRGIVRFVPNGIDLARFAPPTPAQREHARKALDLPLAAFVIGTVGMLRPDKNQARLIRAFNAVRGEMDARLVLVGAGDCRSALDDLSRSLGCADRVVFAGAVTDPSSCYRAFDVFALSSDTEQMPISVLEAMATALPVVSTDVGDVRDMLGEQPADTVTRLGDETRYVAALRSLTTNAELRRMLGSQNRNRVVEQFGEDLMVRRYRDIFLDVMHG